jgi:hypothetical protein
MVSEYSRGVAMESGKLGRKKTCCEHVMRERTLMYGLHVPGTSTYHSFSIKQKMRDDNLNLVTKI